MIWFKENNPRKGFKGVKGWAVNGAELKMAKKAIEELGVTEDEWQKLAVCGWGNEDERVKHFTRSSVPCFVKEIPHLREILVPGLAWRPPEEQRAERYTNGRDAVEALRLMASRLNAQEKQPKPQHILDIEDKKRLWRIP